MNSGPKRPTGDGVDGSPSAAPPPLEKLLTAQEVADILGVHVSYVKNHCNRLKPYIPHVKLGGGRYCMQRFKPSQIAQFIEHQTAVPRRGSM